jgi:N6-adenosine-specific RNA methylase IME4
VSEIDKPVNDTRKTVAKEANLSERKLRYAQTIKKVDLHLYDMVRASKITLIEGKRLAALPIDIRGDAIKNVEIGTDVRTAIRSAKKADYSAKIAKTKPKALEGTYRLFYADPPWKYIGLNKADEYGHAERHYDCLDDNQLCNYKPGNGSRLVKDMADKDAVLFMWVTSPLLKRCFPIIEAWGFEYKACFVWDKVKHVMGHYNSVRHELLLICTRGSCKPDIPTLIDSVQVIERAEKHSEKPKEFYRIIEGMYDHGRKLELFARHARDGWDADGNELDNAIAEK